MNNLKELNNLRDLNKLTNFNIVNQEIPQKRILSFSLDSSLSYQWCGKFNSPTPDWLHLTRVLTDYELFVMTEGTLYIANETEKFQVSKGEYLIMSPTSKQFGYRSSSCSFYWMHFYMEESQFTEDFITLPQQDLLENPERIIILINQLQDTSRRYKHKKTSDLLCTGVLLELQNQMLLRFHEKDKDAASTRNRLYSSILEYISWNKISSLRVSELSSYFGYHEKYLSAFFKEMSGISLKQYLLKEEMEHAKAELMDTNKSISQIGYSIGFGDSHNFSNAFKKVTGLTPSEYRASSLKLPKIP